MGGGGAGGECHPHSCCCAAGGRHQQHAPPPSTPFGQQPLKAAAAVAAFTDAATATADSELCAFAGSDAARCWAPHAHYSAHHHHQQQQQYQQHLWQQPCWNEWQTALMVAKDRWASCSELGAGVLQPATASACGSSARPSASNGGCQAELAATAPTLRERQRSALAAVIRAALAGTPAAAGAEADSGSDDGGDDDGGDEADSGAAGDAALAATLRASPELLRALLRCETDIARAIAASLAGGARLPQPPAGPPVVQAGGWLQAPTALAGGLGGGGGLC